MGTALFIGLVCAALHLGLVGYVVHLILNGKESDWPMYWHIFTYLDFPASLIAIAVLRLAYVSGTPQFASKTTTVTNDLHNFIMPLALFGVGGTIWWFYVPQIVAHWLA